MQGRSVGEPLRNLLSSEWLIGLAAGAENDPDIIKWLSTRFGKTTLRERLISRLVEIRILLILLHFEVNPIKLLLAVLSQIARVVRALNPLDQSDRPISPAAVVEHQHMVIRSPGCFPQHAATEIR